MYSLQLHPSIIAGTHANPIYQDIKVNCARIEIARIASNPVFASATEQDFDNSVFESISPAIAKDIAVLITKLVIVLKKDGAVLDATAANKLSFNYNLTV